MNLLGLKIEADPSPTAKIKWTRRSGVMGATIVLVAGTGIAYAAWSANGVGSGAAKAATSSPVTAVAAASVSTTGGTLLYPGASVPAVINVSNPNPFPVKITALTIGAEAAPDAVPGGGSCTTANALVSMSATSPTGLTTVIGANTTGTVITPANIITMGSNSDTSCQGQTFVFNDPTKIVVTAQSN